MKKKRKKEKKLKKKSKKPKSMPSVVFRRDHLRFTSGIICGPIWGSFAVGIICGAVQALFYVKTSSAICGKKNQCKVCSLWQAEVICKTNLLLSSCVHRNGCFLDVNLSWSNGLENLTDENSAILALKETGQVNCFASQSKHDTKYVKPGNTW
mgnify:CR=1 FL=1